MKDAINSHDEVRFLGIYAISRHYGGPEEGGWWYDWCEHRISFPVTPETIDDVQKQLTELLEPMQPTYDRFSMANDGNDFEVLHERLQGEHQSTERPHYE